MNAYRDLAESRVGTTLRGKWRLDALLGIGGMAAVYAATHRNGRRGAVKIPHPNVMMDEQLRQRFLQEGRAANAVQHPGLVAVLDDDEDDTGCPFLVMELLEGVSAEGALRVAGGVLSWGEVLRIAEGLLDALAAAHRGGVVHRDLKPDNVYLCTDGQIKILDFGIARSEQNASVTQTGTTLGTPAFMAPEQAMGRQDLIGPHTDVWAAGATLFTLLTGRFVHEGATVNEVLVRAATSKAASVGSLVPLPERLGAVIDRALAFDEKKRFRDAGEMLQELRQLRANPGPLRIAVPQPSPAASATTLASTMPLPAELAPTSAAPAPALLRASDTEKRAPELASPPPPRPSPAALANASTPVPDTPALPGLVAPRARWSKQAPWILAALAASVLGGLVALWPRTPAATPGSPGALSSPTTSAEGAPPAPSPSAPPAPPAPDTAASVGSAASANTPPASAAAPTQAKQRPATPSPPSPGGTTRPRPPATADLYDRRK
jgi:serine/threonine-protein kinase